jgi:hypothetical protein
LCLFVRVGFGGLSSLVTSHRTASQIEIVWSCLPSIGMFRNDFVGNDDIVHILYMWHLWWGFQMVDKGVAFCIVGDFCGIHCFVLYIYIYILHHSLDWSFCFTLLWFVLFLWSYMCLPIKFLYKKTITRWFGLFMLSWFMTMFHLTIYTALKWKALFY